ncbi:MAG: hypothetical protein ACTSPP_04465 [Candidatus Heimdallarchaeaceae archaeon]
MYGEEGEHGSPIQGKLFVNNLLNYFYTTTSLPVIFLIIIGPLSVVAIIALYIKQKKR